MKAQVRLNSVVPHGVSGPEAGLLNLLYEYFLIEYGQTSYSYISINQIGQELNEVIIRKGNHVYINIRYPSPINFDDMTDDEKNLVRLEVIHEGLLRLAAKYKKLDISILKTIRNRILDRNFSFEFVYKVFINKKGNLIAKILLRPNSKNFKYFIQFEQDQKNICELLLCSGDTSGYYIPKLFLNAKWEKDNKLILSGKNKNIKVCVDYINKTIEFISLTKYQKSPLFEMFRADSTSEEKLKARIEYEHSLPPSILAILKKSDS